MEGLQGYFFNVCILAAFLLFGKLLRVYIKLFQTLFLPSSIIAGFLALSMGPYGFDLFPPWMASHWSEIPGILINIVFASLFLGVAIPRPKQIWSIGGPQLCFGMVMGVGQYFTALWVTLLLLMPIFDVSPLFATIVEIGFSGGHGTAAGMQQVFDSLGFEAGPALAQMSATVGIISAVVVGIILINFGIRKGYCANLNQQKGIPAYKKLGLIPEAKRFSIATATVATEAIEPLTFHFSIISIAILIGWGILELIRPLHSHLQGFPLFPLAMLGGLLVQGIATVTKVDKYFDRDTFDRIMGFSLDVLVISAIASIRLDLFLENVWPFLIIMTTGVLWLICVFVFLAPRMFPQYWFERGISEFGMQAGVTAVGLLLLRLVDPMYKTKTAEAFGLKQMVYEPFLGGGLVTALAPFLIVGIGPWNSLFCCAGVMIVFFVLSLLNGWVNFSPSRKFEEEISDS